MLTFGYQKKMKNLLKHICKHCKNVQYIPLVLRKLSYKMSCYVCGNEIKTKERNKT